MLLSPSNEPGGNWKQSLPKWVEHWRREDPRRLYTTGTGWSLIDAPGPVQGADYLAVHRIGLNMLRKRIGLVRARLRELFNRRQCARRVSRNRAVVRLPELRRYQEIHRLSAAGKLRNLPRLAGCARPACQEPGLRLGLGPLSAGLLQGRNRGQPAHARA